MGDVFQPYKMLSLEGVQAEMKKHGISVDP